MENHISQTRNYCFIGLFLCFCSFFWLSYESYTNEKDFLKRLAQNEKRETFRVKTNRLDRALTFYLEMAIKTKGGNWKSHYQQAIKKWKNSAIEIQPGASKMFLISPFIKRIKFEKVLWSALKKNDHKKVLLLFQSYEYKVIKERSSFLDPTTQSFHSKKMYQLRLKGLILHLDELLKIAAQNNPQKIESFYKKKLDEMVIKIKNLMEAEVPKGPLLEQEMKAYLLLKKGFQKKASDILRNSTYLKQKDIFLKGLYDLEKQISLKTKKSRSNSKLKMLLFFFVFLFTSLFLFSSSLLCMRLQKWHKKLMERNKRLSKYQKHLFHTQEKEREKISREVHDLLGQNATALKMNLNLLKNRKNLGPDIEERINDMIGLTGQIITDIKQMAFDLRPSVLDHFGLLSALESELTLFGTRSGMSVQFKSPPNFIPRMEKHIESNLFRIIQEGLTNIGRHSKAKNILLEIENNQPFLTIKLKDDGIGFDLEQKDQNKSLGILGMKERCLMIKAEFNIFSQKKYGTQLEISFKFKSC